MDLYSNCCKAKVIDDSDLCSKCGEHCELMEVCPECKGDGLIMVLDHDKVNSRTISPPYKEIECDICGGIGYLPAAIDNCPDCGAEFLTCAKCKKPYCWYCSGPSTANLCATCELENQRIFYKLTEGKNNGKNYDPV